MPNLIMVCGVTRTPKLFKRTTTGKIQEWWLELSGDKYRAVSGQVDGKKVTAAWTTAKPMNVGRSNATTTEEQALAEVCAAWEKKKRDGYSETPAAAEASTDFFPMLAPTKHYNKDEALRKRTLAAIKAKCGWIQPKLDGVRCLVSKEGQLSRKRRPFFACPHISEALASVFDIYPGVIIDGEYYNHEYRHEFNRIIELVKPLDPTMVQFAETRSQIQLWIFDCYFPENPAIAYGERLDLVDRFVRIAERKNPSYARMLQVVPTHQIHRENELLAWYEEFLELEFEGAMLRTPGPYEPGKRSKHLVKLKEMVDIEYRLIDICEGEGNRAGQAGFIWALLPDGRKFKAGIKGKEEHRLALLKNRDKYIGGDVTIQHFEKLTPDGVPRFPSAKVFYQGRRKM